jgi:hypothetical protein
MPNNTFEDYKIAIKRKYEEEKEGEHFNYLNAPTRAKLRDLCWEIFERQDTHSDDLTTFNAFFGFPFDLSIRNRFRDEIDKFRPIETYFKGETDPTNVAAVNLGAILLDFHPRPFSKFRTTNLIDEDQEIVDNVGFELGAEKQEGVLVISTGKYSLVGSKQMSFLGSKNQKFRETLSKKSKGEKVSIVLICCLVSLSIYLAFLKKECMQWTNDHYEFVDCDLEEEGVIRFAAIEPLDKRVEDLRKIRVCDTTIFFNKNDAPLVWYAKTGDSIEYFNQAAPHPLDEGKYLKPITAYMIKKHINGKPCH